MLPGKRLHLHCIARQDSLRLPRWTRWVKYHLRNLGGWVVGRGGLEGGWSDVSPREEGW